MRLGVLSAAVAAISIIGGAGAAQAQTGIDLLAQSVQRLQQRAWGYSYTDYSVWIGSLSSSQQADYVFTPSSASYGNLTVIGTCGQCSDLDLRLWDNYERQWVTEDVAVDAEPTLSWYPVAGRSYTVRVVMYDCPSNACWFSVAAMR